MKVFLYLYPIDFYLDHEIMAGARALGIQQITKASKLPDETSITPFVPDIESLKQGFRTQYFTALNASIQNRYRENGYSIFFALFDDIPVSSMIDLAPHDNIIQVGMDSTFLTQKPGEEIPPPDPITILQQLPPWEELRIGGFHMWDCIDKLASAAYREGSNVLVDEDLTDFLKYRVGQPWFDTGRYPSFDIASLGGGVDMYVTAREKKPWLYQDPSWSGLSRR
ncbi:MAG: hypothetical protein ACMG6E_03835 [Candidatus Roizmanbacteria bacterium]